MLAVWLVVVPTRRVNGSPCVQIFWTKVMIFGMNVKFINYFSYFCSANTYRYERED